MPGMPVRGLSKCGKTGIYSWDFRIDGHRFRGTTETTNRRKAEGIVDTERRKAAALIAQDAGRAPMTFAVASSRWYIEAGQHRAKPGEVEGWLAWLQRHIGNNRRIRDIDGNVLTRLIALRRAEGVKPATINRTVIEPLRAILKRAERWGQSTASVRWGDYLAAEPKERVREASDDEEARILAALRPDYRPAIRFDFLTGLRLEELVSMEWEHIDWGGRRFGLIGKGGVVAWLPLSHAMERILREVHTPDATGPVWRYTPRRRRAKMITDLTPRPITYSGLKSEWKRARKRAGLSSSRKDPVMGFRFHDLRHTALTRITRATGDIRMAQKLGRHADIKTTMRYAHATEDDLRHAMEIAHGQPDAPPITAVKVVRKA